MGKKVIKMTQQQSASHEGALSNIKKASGGKCACCVIITCSESSKDGKMEVEMSFDGEESLASFLVDNAAQIFEDRYTERDSKIR